MMRLENTMMRLRVPPLNLDHDELLLDKSVIINEDDEYLSDKDDYSEYGNRGMNLPLIHLNSNFYLFPVLYMISQCQNCQLLFYFLCYTFINVRIEMYCFSLYINLFGSNIIF